MKIKLLLAIPLLMSCQASQTPDPQDAFLEKLKSLCGNAFQGAMVSSDPVDADFGAQPMVMHVRDCEDTVVRIPFHVGEDHSRTWVISKTETGLRLKHDHRHEDGSEDAVTQYGGDTADAGSADRQEFPVDAYSIEMFEREGLTASVTNIWAVEVTETIYAYELRREGRFFRVEFDLLSPVDLPPPAWGH